jgi:hypothetical protein
MKARRRKLVSLVTILVGTALNVVPSCQQVRTPQEAIALGLNPFATVSAAATGLMQ